jgi:NADP-reducing hydrogenase subunit HndB
MASITSMDGLNRLKEEIVERRRRQANEGITFLRLGMGTCGIAAGARDVLRTLEEEIKAHKLKSVVITQTGCRGLCKQEPILDVIIGNAPTVAYGHVDPNVVERIVREHLLGGNVVKEFVIDEPSYQTI